MTMNRRALAPFLLAVLVPCCSALAMPGPLMPLPRGRE
jgi:hypothetical protein